MAEEFTFPDPAALLIGQVRLGQPLPPGARIRLRRRLAGAMDSLTEGEIGVNGLFRLDYTRPDIPGQVLVEVVDRAGNLLVPAMPLPGEGLTHPQIVTPDGMRPLGEGEGFGIPTTLPQPEVYWRARYEIPTEQLTRSQDALLQLRNVYEAGGRGIGDPEQPTDYPWRLQVNPTTGLPTLLRNRLPQALPPVEEVEAVREVVTSTNFSHAVFGVDLSDSFDETFRAQSTIRLDGGGGGARGLEQNSHLSWRQVYRGANGKEYPVLGGGFRIHGRTSTTDVAITSSYFPLKAGAVDVRVVLSEEEILDRAMAALLALPEMRAKASLLINLLARLEQRRGILSFLDRLRPLLRWLGLARAAHTLVQAKRESYFISDGDTDRAYPLAIVPYAGAYHLSARVSVTLDEPSIWYVDVDVQSGLIVGRPWQPVTHAPFYVSSANAADGPPPAGDFGNAPFGFGAEPSPPLLILPQASGINGEERTTVAVHCQRIYDHFRVTCGAAQRLDSQLQAGQRIKIVLGSNERTQFNYRRNLSQKEIHFEQGQELGIQLNAAGSLLRVFFPARDPEVVLHEMAHALFWLINKEPWEEQDVVSPFGRALHEGYAIYLARSVAAGNDAAERDQPWARGMYRTTDWGDRWRLARPLREVGADFLRMPNQFPAHSFVQGFHNISLEDYDIGMVWARALWDLRTILGPERTDYLAVQAYPYLHGSIVNFESAADGLIEADVRGENLNAGAAVNPIFSTRGLVSNEGVFGFVQTPGGTLAAATDGGARMRGAAGWVADSTPGAEAIAGVVSLAGDGETLYAVVVPPRSAQMNGLPAWRVGLYRRQNNQWTELTGPGATLLGVYVLRRAGVNELFLTTTGGVYRAGGGAPVPLGQNAGDQLPAHDLVIYEQAGGQPRLLVAARSASLAVLRVDEYLAGNPAAVWKTLPTFGNSPRLAALAVRSRATPAGPVDELYVGTLGQGIWRFGVNSQFQPANLTQRLDATILALKANGSRLVWSTPEEVGWSEDGVLAQRLEPPCPGALVVSLLPAADGTLYAGTLAHGIWRLDLAAVAPSWQVEELPSAQEPVEIPAGEERLVSYFHANANQTAQLIVQAGVTVKRLAQPGFPLVLLQPNANQRYGISQGWVVLLVKNETAGLLHVSALQDANDNLAVIAVA